MVFCFLKGFLRKLKNGLKLLGKALQDLDGKWQTGQRVLH